MNCLNINKINALREGIEFARSLKYIVCPMVSMWDIQRVHDFLDEIGIGESYVKTNQNGPYALQANYHYLSELLEGENFRVKIFLYIFKFF